MTAMQPQPTVGVVPMQHQIADKLREAIAAGELKPGDPLPSVSDLAAAWGCSQGPARTAVAILKSEGLVTGGRGKPAHVRARPRRIELSMDWTQEQKDLVLRPQHEREVRGAIELTAGIPIADTNSTHLYDVMDATEELAHEFDIEPGAKLSRRQYEMSDKKTGIRLSWSVSYIPIELIKSNPDLLDETKEPWPGGHQHQLYTVGIEIDRFIRSVVSIEPTTGERQKWGMELGVPLLRVRSRSIDVNDRTVELSDAMYPADRTEIAFTEKLKRWPKGYPRYSSQENGETA